MSINILFDQIRLIFNYLRSRNFLVPCNARHVFGTRPIFFLRNIKLPNFKLFESTKLGTSPIMLNIWNSPILIKKYMLILSAKTKRWWFWVSSSTESTVFRFFWGNPILQRVLNRPINPRKAKKWILKSEDPKIIVWTRPYMP